MVQDTTVAGASEPRELAELATRVASLEKKLASLLEGNGSECHESEYRQVLAHLPDSFIDSFLNWACRQDPAAFPEEATTIRRLQSKRHVYVAQGIRLLRRFCQASGSDPGLEGAAPQPAQHDVEKSSPAS